MSAAFLLALALAADDGCTVKEVQNGISVIRYIGDRACVEFKDPREYHGMYVDCFEGQMYYDGAATLAEVRKRQDKVWFRMDEKTHFSVNFQGPRGRCEAYRVTFIGKEAKDMARTGPLNGYGHMGGSAGLVLVDDLTGAIDIGDARAR